MNRLHNAEKALMDKAALAIRKRRCRGLPWVESDRARDTRVVRLIGELDAVDVDVVVAHLTQGHEPTVFVDLDQLTFLDRRALRAILQVRRAFERQGRTLVLRGARGAVRRLFEVQGISSYLHDAPVKVVAGRG